MLKVMLAVALGLSFFAGKAQAGEKRGLKLPPEVVMSQGNGEEGGILLLKAGASPEAVARGLCTQLGGKLGSGQEIGKTSSLPGKPSLVEVERQFPCPGYFSAVEVRVTSPEMSGRALVLINEGARP
jgi:hypothetical protein